MGKLFLVVFEVGANGGEAIVDCGAFDSFRVFVLGCDALGLSVPGICTDSHPDCGDVAGLVDSDGSADSMLVGFLALVGSEVVKYGHSPSIFRHKFRHKMP